MDYESMAAELLRLRAKLHRIPADQKLSKMVRGEQYVLNYLAAHEQVVHPKELSEQMCVSTARVAALLNHMEEKKLICRSADPSDSRQVIVRLTPAGRTAIERLSGEVIRYVAAMLENLGPEDAEAYIRIQEKIWLNFTNTV